MLPLHFTYMPGLDVDSYWIQVVLYLGRIIPGSYYVQVSSSWLKLYA